MFTKQVSRPVDGLDPPSRPPRPRRVANSKGDLVTGPIRGSCALQGPRPAPSHRPGGGLHLGPGRVCGAQREALRNDHPRPRLKGGASLVDTHGKTNQRGGLNLIIFWWGGRNAKDHGPILPQILGLALPAAVMSILLAACVSIHAAPSEQATSPPMFDDT